MAHTHDRTLLASLGFQDPDKKDPRHTLACQYLCQSDVALRLAKRVRPAEMARTEEEVRASISSEHRALMDAFGAARARHQATEARKLAAGTDWWHIEGKEGRDEHARVLTEYTELKRRIDASSGSWLGLQVKMSRVEVAITRGAGGFLVGFWDVVIDTEARYMNGAGSVGQHHFDATICVEVKAKPVDVADIARQIATYHTASAPTATVVATCYPTTKMDRDTLAAKGIHHVYLGPDFDKFCQRARTADSEGEL